jgi:hypothetical protein
MESFYFQNGHYYIIHINKIDLCILFCVLKLYWTHFLVSYIFKVKLLGFSLYKIMEEGYGGGGGARGEKWPKHCMAIWIKEKNKIKKNKSCNLKNSHLVAFTSFSYQHALQRTFSTMLSENDKSVYLCFVSDLREKYLVFHH